MIKKISCYLFYRWKLLAKVKNLFSSLLLFAIFISCETDDFQNGKSENNSSFKIGESKTSQLNFREFQNDQEAFNVFELLNGTTENTTFSRGGYYDENFRLELDTTRIFKIESAYRHSYTFRIVDDHTENQPVKNLILDYREEARGYYAYIATYYLDERQQNELRSGAVLSDFKNYMELNSYQPDYTTQSLNDDCFDIIISPAQPCTGNQHHMPGEGCELTGSDAPAEPMVLIIAVPCGNGGGGGGSTGGPPPNPWNPPSTGGGGYSGPGNPTTYPGSNPEDPTDDGVVGPVDAFLDGIKFVPVLEPEEPEEDDCDTSKEDLIELFPNANEDEIELLEEMINGLGTEFDIDTVEELQHFLAQAGHESGGFTDLNVTENLNYSAQRLVDVWPTRFSFTDPNKKNPNNYANDPEALANYVYCCRMGNGDESSGDGYKYRGRGIFQLTGKINYNAYHDFLINKDIGWTYTEPSDLENSIHAILSALWFYQENVLDNIDIDENTTADDVTEYINPYTDQNSKDARQDVLDDAEEEIECQ